VKCKIAAVLFLLAGFLGAQAASAQTTVCAQTTDKENLCKWNGTACHLNVEKMDRTHACQYDQSTASDYTNHKPMCFSVAKHHHILFNSNRNRPFRIRRFVPITATNANGQACPVDPFGHHFDTDPGKNPFGGAIDSQTARASAVGCKYKLEVEFKDTDPKAPSDADGVHHECRDPHLLVQ
jgi:hypothetical protein